MSTWLLEAYGTDSRYGDDVRFRAYTTSRKQAEAFNAIPRIQFTDSGHGIVFSAIELAPRTPRKPKRYELSGYVREHMRALLQSEPGKPSSGSRPRPRTSETGH
jgi:hypothetical protein